MVKEKLRQLYIWQKINIHIIQRTQQQQTPKKTNGPVKTWATDLVNEHSWKEAMTQRLIGSFKFQYCGEIEMLQIKRLVTLQNNQRLLAHLCVRTSTLWLVIKTIWNLLTQNLRQVSWAHRKASPILLRLTPWYTQQCILILPWLMTFFVH